MTVNLDQLEQLADIAGDGLFPDAWWNEDDFAEGFPVPPGVDKYLAALDPSVVLALIRSVRADLEVRRTRAESAQAWNAIVGTHPNDPVRAVAYAADAAYGKATVEHDAALEPFRNQP